MLTSLASMRLPMSVLRSANAGQAREPAGHEIQDHDDEDQDEGGPPGPGDRGVARAARLVVDDRRKGGLWTAERVVVDRRGVADEEKQRSGLADDAGHAKH